MNEFPTTSLPVNPESPLPDPNLFLMREINRRYLAGKTVRPQLSSSRNQNESAWRLLLSGIILFFFLMTCISPTSVSERLPDLSVPNPPDFSVPTVNGMILFLLILLAMGVVVVIRDWREARQARPSQAVSPSAVAETPVTVAPQRPKAQVLDGIVVQAEKIVSQGQYGAGEKIGVRYQFAAPGGVIIYGYDTGISKDASDPMAPVPGTPVKVYYEAEERHYLL